MRLIDADALIEIIKKEKEDNDAHCRLCMDATIDIIDEQPTVEEKPKKRGWKCKPHQKGLLYRLSKECCYEDRVANGKARNGKCGGVMGSDKSFDYLNSFCVSCPYLELSKYEREKE